MEVDESELMRIQNEWGIHPVVKYVIDNILAPYIMDDRFIKVMKGSYEYGREDEKLQQRNTSISESRYDGGFNGQMDDGTSRASGITFGSSVGEVHTSGRGNGERNVSRNVLNKTFKDVKVDMMIDIDYLNCTFVNVDFSNAKLSNVNFKGSSIIEWKFADIVFSFQMNFVQSLHL